MDQAEPYHGQDRPERHREPGHLGQEQSAQDSPERTAPLYPVIVGYDGSRAARNALAYAAGMARRQERSLLGVYVSSTSGPAAAHGVPVARDTEAVERWLRTELAEVASPVGVEVHVRTRWGSPARELSALATELSADALVIGASARSWYRLGGTVPGWLAAHASCPVFVIP
jgi:nucleotide-binding universal stress UspA family protein